MYINCLLSVRRTYYNDIYLSGCKYCVTINKSYFRLWQIILYLWSNAIKSFTRIGFVNQWQCLWPLNGHYFIEKTSSYHILLKVLTYIVSVRNILHITASALIIRGCKNCLNIYNIQAVILSRTVQYITIEQSTIVHSIVQYSTE